jgi:HK97 gp10 family phage protein
MTLHGFDALQRALATAPEVVRTQTADAVSATAFAIAQRMRTLAPRASGTLRSAIQARSRGTSGRVEIGSEAFYWRFLEYGTKQMAARPFVRTSAEFESATFLARIRAIGQRLEQTWGTGRFT